MANYIINYMKKTLIIVITAIAVILSIYLSSDLLGKNDTKEPSVTSEPASVAADLSKEPIYTNETYGYSIKLPSTLEVEQMTPHSIQLVTKEKEIGQGPTNFIYISVIPQDMKESIGEIYNYYADDYNELINMTKQGSSISVTDVEQPDLDEWNTYTFANTVQIDGITAKVFENYKPWEFPNGTTETRYMFEKNGTRYLLGYYTGGDSVGKAAIDPRIANAIVHSFDLK